AFVARGAGDVGVGEFVNDRYFRSPRDNAIRVHVFEGGAAVLGYAARDQLQPLSLCNGFETGMGLKIADHDIPALLFQILRLAEHLIGLANAGSVAEEDFQLALPVFGRHQIVIFPMSGSRTLRKDTNVHSLCRFDEAVDQPLLPEFPGVLQSVADEYLRDALL